MELAAVALALCLTQRVARLGKLEVARYGQRADYHAPRRQCVVEVSGTELASELERRHRQKIAQALANPLGWDAYVVVCAFGRKGLRIRFPRHEVVESADG